MDAEFWARAWATGRTGFHEAEANRVLIQHAARLLQAEQEVVFVPLCGRSMDMIWLEAQGHTVVGCELVPEAVSGFFAEHGRAVEPVELERPAGVASDASPLVRWRSGRITVLQGDVFALPHHPARPRATAVWDRAALVALPPALRATYAQEVLPAVCVPGARILLNVFDYNPEEMSGPPFSVPEAEVRRLFAGCSLELLAREDGRARMSRPDRPLSRFEVDTWLITLPA